MFNRLIAYCDDNPHTMFADKLYAFYLQLK
jgi:hypothetical protein